MMNKSKRQAIERQLEDARNALETIDIYTDGNPILDAIAAITSALDTLKGER